MTAISGIQLTVFRAPIAATVRNLELDYPRNYRVEFRIGDMRSVVVEVECCRITEIKREGFI